MPSADLPGLLPPPRPRRRPNQRLGQAPRAGRLVRLLWAALRARGASVAWLAEASGVAHATLRQWRSGERSPKAEHLERAFRALGLDLIPMPRAERRRDERAEQQIPMPW